MDQALAGVIRLARQQNGVVARDQALALRISSSRWDRLEAAGWTRIARGILAAPWGGDEPLQRLTAYGLAARPDGGVTGEAALWLHGLQVRLPARAQLVVPHGQRGPLPREVDVRRSRTLLPEDLVTVRSVPTVAPARALLDLAADHRREELREWLIDARQRRVASPADVWRRASKSRGSTGRPRLLAAIEDVSKHGADSPFTALVQEALVAHGRPPDPYPATVTGRRTLHPDITYAAERVAIECDSLAYHATHRALDLDSRKHNTYALAGWTVLRITWRRFHRDLEGFLAEVTDALDRAGR